MQRVLHKNIQKTLTNTIKASTAMKLQNQPAEMKSQIDAGVSAVHITTQFKEGRLREPLATFHEVSKNENDTSIDFNTYVSLLQACARAKELDQGKQIHAHILKNGIVIDMNVPLASSLVNMYANSGSIVDARHVFDKMPERSPVAWNAIIKGLVTHGNYEGAIDFYYKMEGQGLLPDKFTFPLVIKACSVLQALKQGREIHGCIIKVGLEWDLFVGSALVDMYSKCGVMDCAHQVFDKMRQRDVVLWTAMIAGYAQNGRCDEAVMLFRQMEYENVRPNIFTWNAMIAGYAQHGPRNEALNQLHQMQLVGMKPDSVTIVSVLPACAHLAALQQGKEIHDYIIRRGFESDVFVMSALIDMYGKCGIIEFARHVFDKTPRRDVVSWNSMIVAYGMHGYGEDALVLFSQMQQQHMKPNYITFINVLSACSHAGLIDEGLKCFNCMIQNYDIMPRTEHYACVVDLLGRVGRLDEAHDFIKKMPVEPSIDLWGALLGACRIYGNVELGERVAEHIFQLNTDDAGHYVMLSNIYAEAGRWDCVEKVRTMLKGEGLKKLRGCSWINVNNRVHEFFVGGNLSHSLTKYESLDILDEQMKQAGALA